MDDPLFWTVIGLGLAMYFTYALIYQYEEHWNDESQLIGTAWPGLYHILAAEMIGMLVTMIAIILRYIVTQVFS